MMTNFSSNQPSVNNQDCRHPSDSNTKWVTEHLEVSPLSLFYGAIDPEHDFEPKTHLSSNQTSVNNQDFFDPF